MNVSQPIHNNRLESDTHKHKTDKRWYRENMNKKMENETKQNVACMTNKNNAHGNKMMK